MKILATAIAVSTILFTAPSFAFFADNGASDSQVQHQGKGDVKGNGNAEGEASFSMSFTGKGKTSGDFTGNGQSNSNGAMFAEQRDVYRPPYYGNPNYNFPVEEK